MIYDEIRAARDHAEREFGRTREDLRRAATELVGKMAKLVAELDKEARGEPALRPNFGGEAGQLAHEVDGLCATLEIRREHMRAWVRVERQSATPEHE